jgi:hypothetical protein
LCKQNCYQIQPHIFIIEYSSLKGFWPLSSNNRSIFV